MTVHIELVHQMALGVAARVAARTVRHLSAMPAGLSGDDSGLRTAWEEFCVQVQGEESFFWETYQETVRQCISGVLSRRSRLEMVALWLQSDAAIDWLADNESGRELPGVYEPDVVEFVYEVVRRLAEDSRNHRVVRFLAREEGYD